MDVDIKSLLDVDTTFGTTKQIQRLQCSDPRTVTKYNELLWKMIHEAGINKQIDKIYKATTLNNRHNQVLWEKVDKDLTTL
jgi:hypothetical protein